MRAEILSQKDMKTVDVGSATEVDHFAVMGEAKIVPRNYEVRYRNIGHATT